MVGEAAVGAAAGLPVCCLRSSCAKPSKTACMPCPFTLHLAACAGNLELHRGLAGQSLFTNINVGIGDHAMQSGGPASSGPNTVAFTTFWQVEERGCNDVARQQQQVMRLF